MGVDCIREALEGFGIKWDYLVSFSFSLSLFPIFPNIPSENTVFFFSVENFSICCFLFPKVSLDASSVTPIGSPTRKTELISTENRYVISSSANWFFRWTRVSVGKKKKEEKSDTPRPLGCRLALFIDPCGERSRERDTFTGAGQRCQIKRKTLKKKKKTDLDFLMKRKDPYENIKRFRQDNKQRETPRG